jgi:lysophospholipase
MVKKDSRPMELIDTPANPCPPGASIVGLRTRDGAILRAAYWRPEGTPRGTVAIVQGRSEFIEKYFEVIGELLARNYFVVAFDWRGQGLSRRLLSDSAKGHVRQSTDYRYDLEALVDQALAPDAPKPWFALAHSMGAAALLDHVAALGGSPFARIVATAPMLALQGFAGSDYARALTGLFMACGLSQIFVPGGGRAMHYEKPFGGNILTADRLRFDRMAGIVSAFPALRIGDPTVGWIHAAYQIMGRLARPGHVERIKIPILMLAAGDERLVSTPAAEAMARRLKNGACIVLPGARHEILMERPEIRAKFWAAFDAFVPGEQFLPTVEAG